MGMFTILLGEVVDYVTGKHAGEQTRNIPSQEDATGKIDFDRNGKPDFIINHDDPRYIESQKTALAMKDKIDPDTGKTYGELLTILDPKNPNNFEKISEIEKDIVNVVNAKVHEQFGDYDKELSAAIKKGTRSGLEDRHEEFDRRNTEDPVQLKEFKNDELNCRHYAPLANDLLAQAGMKVTRTYGITSEIVVDREKNEATANKLSSAHETVISELTGNIAEFTIKAGSQPYVQTYNKITPQEFEKGVSLSQFSLGDNKTVIMEFFDSLPQNFIDKMKVYHSIESENKAIVEEYNNGNPKHLVLKLHNTPHRPDEIPDTIKDMAKSVACEYIKCTGAELTPPPQTPTTGQDTPQQTR